MESNAEFNPNGFRWSFMAEHCCHCSWKLLSMATQYRNQKRLKLVEETECCNGLTTDHCHWQAQNAQKMQTITELCWYSASQEAFHANANKSFFVRAKRQTDNTLWVTNVKCPARNATQTLTPEKNWMQPNAVPLWERCITWRRSICYGPLELLRKTLFLLRASACFWLNKSHFGAEHDNSFARLSTLQLKSGEGAGEGHQQGTEQGNSNRKFGAIQSDAIEIVRRQHCTSNGTRQVSSNASHSWHCWTFVYAVKSNLAI